MSIPSTPSTSSGSSSEQAVQPTDQPSTSTATCDCLPEKYLIPPTMMSIPSTSKANFDSLPDDLLVRISHHLPLRSYQSFRAAYRKAYEQVSYIQDGHRIAACMYIQARVDSKRAFPFVAIVLHREDRQSLQQEYELPDDQIAIEQAISYILSVYNVTSLYIDNLHYFPAVLRYISERGGLPRQVGWCQSNDLYEDGFAPPQDDTKDLFLSFLNATYPDSLDVLCTEQINLPAPLADLFGHYCMCNLRRLTIKNEFDGGDMFYDDWIDVNDKTFAKCTNLESFEFQSPSLVSMKSIKRMLMAWLKRGRAIDHIELGIKASMADIQKMLKSVPGAKIDMRTRKGNRRCHIEIYKPGCDHHLWVDAYAYHSRVQLAYITIGRCDPSTCSQCPIPVEVVATRPKVDLNDNIIDAANAVDDIDLEDTTMLEMLLA